jgi:hypothetical protein
MSKISKKAECIRTVANWSIADKAFAYDHATFDKRKMLEMMPVASPKLEALFAKIKELDDADMRRSRKHFKHMIFTDLKSSSYGAKLLAGAFAAKGFNAAYDKDLVISEASLRRTEGNNFAVLCSTVIYGKPLGAKFRKKILEVFNSRPDNIHGELVRFIILDQGFKEGIDLYDIKYIHLFEPLITGADEKQAVGRGTRLCGQKGLEFDPRRGWPLYVYRYEVGIPEGLQEKYNTNRMFDLFLEESGIDLRKMVFASTLEQVCIYGAVDNELTKHVHKFSIRKHDDQETIGVRSLLGLLEGGVRKKKNKHRERHHKRVNAPRNRKDFWQMREYVRERFGKKYTWPEAKLENQCINHGGADIVEFNPTQDFVRLYFQPHSSYKGMLLWHSTGTGKCHAKDTPILMFDGTIKMVQDIQVGDMLMGDDSTPRKVLSLARGKDDMYDIIPQKGDKYCVNSEHILVLKYSGISITNNHKRQPNTPYRVTYFDNKAVAVRNKSFRTLEEAKVFVKDCQDNRKLTVEIEVKDFLKLAPSLQRNLKGIRTGVEFQEKIVPVDPYLLGLLLGDGCFTTADKEILDYVINEVHHESNYGEAGNNYINNFLKENNLINNKHIPYNYLVNNRENRLKLLAGLVDTDGWYDKKGKYYEITQKSDVLASEILFLARSLGFAAYNQKYVKSCLYKGERKEGTYNRIFISGDLTEVPVLLPRKRPEKRMQKKDVLVTSIEVAHTGRGDYYGFTLDGNNRYLLGDFTITHNTCSAVATASTSWERHDYTILWVTRHTLKPDIWKNMYKQVCSLVIRDKVRKGELPEDAIKAPLKHTSKAWVAPMSYKQFSNMLAGKNAFYEEMVKRNGRDDVLKKTFIIIDEAHKLFADDVVASERPDVDLIYKSILDSYDKSGKDSARVLLMTATPYTSDPMHMVRLLNLMRPRSEAMKEDFAEFAAEYLDRTGKFSGDGGYERFLDDITGYISYLNREKDARQFSYPVYENVIVPMTTSERAKHAAELARVTEEATGLDENIKQGTEALKKAKAQIREDRKKVVKECGKLPTKKEKDACKEEADKEMTRFERELLADLGARIENDKEQLGDLKKRITTIKKELKNKKADYSQEAALEVRCGLKS